MKAYIVMLRSVVRCLVPIVRHLVAVQTERLKVSKEIVRRQKAIEGKLDTLIARESRPELPKLLGSREGRDIIVRTQEEAVRLRMAGGGR